MDETKAIGTADDLLERRLNLGVVVGSQDAYNAGHGPGLTEACVRAADSAICECWLDK